MSKQFKDCAAAWCLTVTIGAMLEAVPSDGFKSLIWCVVAIFAAFGFVRLSKDKS